MEQRHRWVPDGDTESEEFRELLVRWFQFGLFCPIMRLHGSRLRTKDQPERYPGIIEKSGGPNEIWRFGEKNDEIIRSLIELRERLRPYIMEHMEENRRTDAPLMRPMFFAYYENEECYKLEDQYLFGPDILFSPIMEKGQTQRQVYLPEGRWISVIDRQVYQGKGWVTVHAELCGKEIGFQLVDNQMQEYWNHKYMRVLVDVTVPALGYTTVALSEKEMECSPVYLQEREHVAGSFDDYMLKNERLTVKFSSASGRIVSMRDKENGTIHHITLWLGACSGDARKAEQMATSCNHALFCQPSNSHHGSLPMECSLLQAKAEYTVISAVLPGRDGSVLIRAYEMAGEKETVTLEFGADMMQARPVNLFGKKQEAEVTVSGRQVAFAVKPHALAGVEVVLN